jgi:hypothetical protein
MPGFNGSGTFVRTHDWTQDRSNGVTVNADRMDAEHDGFATGLSTCITKDGQTTVTADIPMASHKFTGLSAGSAAGDSVRYEQLFAGVPTVGTGNDTLTSDDIGKLNSYDCTSGAITVTLPSAVDVGNGAEISIVKTDPSGNFVTINTVSSQLLGYPSAKYSFHGTAGTAVSNNGGFVRVTMSEENRVFVTGDKVRISGVVGFSGLNADFTITRPTSASGVSATAIDLTLAYSAGYTSGGTVQWIQTSHKLRVCNGTVTYVSNGTHWVVKYATPDVFTGPKDYLFSDRNSTYAGPGIPGVGPAGAAGNLSAVYNAYSRRPIFENAAFIQNTDPVDIIIGIMYREAGILSEATATRTPIAQGQGAIYGVASTQTGAVSTRTAAITFLAAEDITSTGSGGHLRLGTTLPGGTSVTDRLELRARGHIWIGGNERGPLLVDPNNPLASEFLAASANVSDGDTVTIDGVVYTFETGALDAAYKVKVGATTAASIDNLIDAINLTGTAGTTYGTGTAVHPTVHALSRTSSTDQLEVVAKTAGAAGNSIAISESSGVLSWTGGATTLSGGDDANLSHLGVRGDSTGATVTLRADAVIGGVSNIAMHYSTKGTGTHKFFSDGTAGVAGTVQQFEVGRVASAVSYPVARGAVAGAVPILLSGGAATDIGLRVSAKGNAPVFINKTMLINAAAASYATAGNITYTAAEVLDGIIVRDCAGAGRTDTLPTAALLVAAIPGVANGDVARVYIINGSDAAEAITLAAGSGGVFDTNQTAASRVIPQNTSKMVHIRFTDVGSGTEAYAVFA